MMRPSWVAFLSILLWTPLAIAAPPTNAADDALPASASAPPSAAPAAQSQVATAPVAESDVLALPRKAVLKTGRVELLPFAGLSINDPLIRHWAFGGQLNYFLTDVFSVGIEGTYYRRNRTQRSDLIGLQYSRVPTLNEILWSAALNFGYVPIYGKFAMLNRSIVHWELEFLGGVGITHTQILPRNPFDAVFDNYDITPNLGVGARVFLTDWLTLWIGLRDYIFPDKFESTSRPSGQSADQAKDQADTKIVNNVVFSLGIGFFLPTSFRYHTAR